MLLTNVTLAKSLLLNLANVHFAEGGIGFDELQIGILLMKIQVFGPVRRFHELMKKMRDRSLMSGRSWRVSAT
ncbi:MAG: hypothetical protein ACPL7K_05140 [Armatimonadota bacterium]